LKTQKTTENHQTGTQTMIIEQKRVVQFRVLPRPDPNFLQGTDYPTPE